jgi:hypothetical protein
MRDQLIRLAQTSGSTNREQPGTTPVATSAPATRGPRGSRIGDKVIAEGSRWTVEGLDLARREATCRLVGGSRAVRRFKARRILKVERAKASCPAN